MTPVAAVNMSFDAIPAELRQPAQWVAWRLERLDEPKPTKVPYNARTGDRAKSTVPTTWSTFDDAVRAYRDGDYDGIGYVFASDGGYVGIDLDGCRDPETGAIAPWALDIIGDTYSYTEVSPSGLGLHIFLRGTLPRGARRRGPVEIYDQGRYTSR